MQICSGGTNDRFIRNNFNLNTGESSRITINTTPGGPTLTSATASSVPPPVTRSATTVPVKQQSSAPAVSAKTPGSPSPPESVHVYQNITTSGDFSLNEYSPSQPEYDHLLKHQASYFYDHYSDHYNEKLSPQQNILAFKHFEETQKMNVDINTNKKRWNMNNERKNINFESENIENESENIINEYQNITKNIPLKELDSDSIQKMKYNNLMNDKPQLLENSFNFALSHIPNNHNKSKIHPLSEIIQDPHQRMIHPYPGLMGGMPRARGRKGKTKEGSTDSGLLHMYMYICSYMSP